MDIVSRFVGYFPVEEYRRAFEDRSMPTEIKESASAKLVQFIQPKQGFDAKWRLVVQRLSYKVGNQTLVNKPIVADIILRSIGDPRFVLTKFIMSPDNSAGHGPSNLSDVGILSFNTRNSLIFDLLGDIKLPHVYPNDMLNYFSTSEIFHEEILKIVRGAAINNTFTPRLETNTYRQRCPGVDCDIVHEVSGTEDKLRIQAKILKEECSQEHQFYGLDMVQIFGRSDQKLKSLSLHMELQEKATLFQIDADMTFIGYETKSGNDDHFSVYGEVVDQKWFH